MSVYVKRVIFTLCAVSDKVKDREKYKSVYVKKGITYPWCLSEIPEGSRNTSLCTYTG